MDSTSASASNNDNEISEARIERRRAILAGRIGGQRDQRRRRRGLTSPSQRADAPGGSQSVEPRHPYVEQDGVERVRLPAPLPRLPRRRRAVHAFGHCARVRSRHLWAIGALMSLSSATRTRNPRRLWRGPPVTASALRPAHSRGHRSAAPAARRGGLALRASRRTRPARRSGRSCAVRTATSTSVRPACAARRVGDAAARPVHRARNRRSPLQARILGERQHGLVFALGAFDGRADRGESFAEIGASKRNARRSKRARLPASDCPCLRPVRLRAAGEYEGRAGGVGFSSSSAPPMSSDAREIASRASAAMRSARGTHRHAQLVESPHDDPRGRRVGVLDPKTRARRRSPPRHFWNRRHRLR